MNSQVLSSGKSVFLPCPAPPSWEPIEKYINEQYEKFLKEEVNIARKKRIPDTRVHCCLYFISPTGHSYVPAPALVCVICACSIVDNQHLGSAREGQRDPHIVMALGVPNFSPRKSDFRTKRVKLASTSPHAARWCSDSTAHSTSQLQGVGVREFRAPPLRSRYLLCTKLE